MYAELAIEITENGNYTPVLTLAWTLGHLFIIFS